MVAGLTVIKAGVVAATGPLVGLSRSESIRTGFMLAQVRLGSVLRCG
jgi:hypothetical protein